MVKIFCISILFLLMVGFSSLVSAEDCTDSDNGKDYYVKGTTTGDFIFHGEVSSVKSVDDTCNGDLTVIENYCNDAGYRDWVSYDCPNGCKDGACLPVPAEEKASCTDSDELNYYVKGYIVYKGITDFDYCDSIGSDILVEKVCDDWRQYKTYICPNGCTDGACIPGDEKEIDQESMSIKTTKSAYNVDEIITGREARGSDKMIEVHTKLPRRMDCDQYFVSSAGQEISFGSGGCLVDGISFGANPSTFGVDEWKAKIIAKLPNTEKSYTIFSSPFIIYSKSSCIETDGGQNYYAKGLTIDTKGGKAEDFCKTSDYLLETYCEADNSIGKLEYKCPEGCENDACLPFYGEDEAIEVPEEDEEEIKSSKKCPQKTCETISEECIGENKLVNEECKVYIKSYDDNTCNEIKTTNSKVIREACVKQEETFPKKIVCQGCQIDKSTCIPFGTRLERKDVAYYCDISKEMIEQKENKGSCQNSYECKSNNCKDSLCSSICNGCLNKDNVCVLFGTRTKTQYCDVDFSFKNQESEDMSCNNNYECSTNVCVDSKCISTNLIQKIIMWFKNLFG